MKMNKKGIELSVNFLVIFILSIVMLSMGVMLIKNWYDSSIDIHQRISEQEQSQIESILARGEKVAIPIKSKSIRRGEFELLGLGVLNIKNSEQTFSAGVIDVKAYDPNNQEIENPQSYMKVNIENPSFTLKPNEIEKNTIFAKAEKNAQLGKYIYTVEVNDSNSIRYGSPVRFIINVI